MSTTTEQYPQHEKLSKVMETSDSQTIGSFLEWFFANYDVYPKGTVGEYMEQADGFRGFAEALIDGDIKVEYPMQVLSGDQTFNKILAEFYDIDYDELMDEKERMYQSLREKANA